MAPGAGTVYASSRRMEYGLQVHLVVAQPFRAVPDWALYAGTDVHWRALFDYFEHRVEPLEPTLSATLAYFRPHAGAPGFYLRAQWGQMPWGMFRETGNFARIGAGMWFAFGGAPFWWQSLVEQN